MYLLRLSLRPWRLAPLSQLFSALAVGSLLLLGAFLYWMHQGLRPVLERLHGEQVVTAYLETSVEAKDESKVVETLRQSLGALSSKGNSAPEIKLVGATEFLGLIKSQYPELAKELEDLGKDMSVVIPRYISVSGMLPSSAVDKINAIPGIEHAESSKDRYRHIVGAFSALRWVARILMGGIALALLTGLIHLARMNGYLHQDALSLLKFWGAGSAKLFVPSAISGFLVGLGGGALAWAGWATSGILLTQHVRSLSIILKGMPAASSHFGMALLFLGGIVGVLSGALGTVVAASPTGGTHK